MHIAVTTQFQSTAANACRNLGRALQLSQTVMTVKKGAHAQSSLLFSDHKITDHPATKFCNRQAAVCCLSTTQKGQLSKGLGKEDKPAEDNIIK